MNVSRLVVMADSDSAPSPGIRTRDQRLRVFVSSTIHELEAERRAARAAIEQLRLAPVMFESGANPHPAQAVYHAFIDQSDIFVGIYWQSYGWVGPDTEISGLEDELKTARGKPRLLYVKRPAPEMNPGLSRMLKNIKSEGGLTYKPFADAGELRELLLNDLATLITERFGDTGRNDRRSPVPAPVTGLVGRDRDVAEVASLVRAEDHRLVVLTGVGGVGKTRLALAVLEETRPHWDDGIGFADLSGVSDPSLVAENIATALGFTRQGREAPLDTVERRLAGKHVLIVLDNFDQVLEAAPLLPELLERAPRLRLLVTSRVVLRVRGEREWRVEPLGLLPADDAPDEVPAVRLLVDRIRNARPGFEVTSDNAEAIAELCRRLDGLPLALELAASWMRLLNPPQLLQRLDERMQRPGALVDLPDRQRTMAATVEWSYQLLPEAARHMLARLTVFAAPFTADAVEAVCGQDAVAAAESLAVLVDHNMVSPAERPDGERAFTMLNVIRHFASERLDSRDDTMGGMEKYLLGVLERAGSGHGSEGWARRLLDSEFPSLLAVLSWAVERERPSGELLRRVGDVWVWLLVRGHLRRASALSRRIESWPAAGLRGERDMLARKWLLGFALQEDGQYGLLGELIDEILPDARRLEKPSRWGLMVMVRAVSRPYAAGSPAGGELEEALAVARDAGDPVFLGYALSHRGLFLSVDGDPAQARGLHEEMLTVARAAGDDNQLAEAHYALALDALLAGGPGPAGSHLAAAARGYADIDHREGLARCLVTLAALALRRQDAHLAARLVGAADAVRATGLTLWPVVAEAEDRFIGQIRAALPEEEYTADVSAGRNDTAETALQRAWAALEDEA
jgi:predicted ATPase